jgi:hypothetical protein
MIDGKCNLKSVNNIITKVSMIILTIVLIGTILYFIYIKKNSLYEQYENVDITTPSSSYEQSVVQYGDSSCTFPKFKYPENMNFRDCQVYFTSNINDCDNAKSTNPENTCKYIFNGWKEFDSTISDEGNQISYPKKIYNKQYTNDAEIINGSLVNKCFKPFSQNAAKKFEYQNNALVNHDCKGTTGRTDNDTNLFNNTLYSSFNFLNDTNSLTNYNNLINSICSVKYTPLNDLKNKFFYKFILNANNTIQDIKRCTFNLEQTDLIDDANFSLNKFISNNTSYGLEYIGVNSTNSKKIFKVFQVNSYPPRSVNVYTFKYNYLCKNSQIMSFDKQQKQIHVNNFINTPTIQETNIEIDVDNSVISNWDNYRNVDNEKTDKRQRIINDLNAMMNNRYTLIDNAYSSEIATSNTQIETNTRLKTTAIESMTSYNPETINDIINDVNRIIVPNTTRPFLNLNINRGIITKSTTIDTGLFNILYNTSITYSTKGNLKKGLMMWKIEGYFNDNFDYIAAKINVSSIFIHGVTRFDNLLSATTNSIDGTESLGQLPNIKDNYSMMWKGIFYAHNGGYYKFRTVSDDASYVILNGDVIVNNGGTHPMWYKESISKELKMNSLNEIIIYFGEAGGGDNLIFEWQYEGSNSWNNTGNYNGKDYLWHYCNDCKKCNNNCNDSNIIDELIEQISSIHTQMQNILCWYKFDGSDTNMLLDSTANVYHLTNINNSIFSSAINDYISGTGAVKFTGTSYLTHTFSNNLFNPQGTYTITLWAKIAGNTNYQSIISTRPGDGTLNGYTLYITPYRTLSFQMGNNTGSWYAIHGTTLINTTLTWYHIAIVVKAGQHAIYLNGVLDGTSSDSMVPSVASGSGTFQIGTNQVGRYIVQNGTCIDDIRIYNRELNISEIIGLYQYSDINNKAIYSITNESSPYKIQKYNYQNQYTVILKGNIYNSINIYSYIFLQKGYYKFYAQLTNQNSYFNSTLNIFSDAISDKLILINSLRLVQDNPKKYKESTLSKFIEIKQGGFYKILFQYVGKNNSLSDITSIFKIYAMYNSRPPPNNYIPLSSLDNNAKFDNQIKNTLNYDNLTNLSMYLYYGFNINSTNADAYDKFSEIKYANNNQTSLSIFKNYINTNYDYFGIQNYQILIDNSRQGLIRIDNEKNIKKTLQPVDKRYPNILPDPTIQNIESLLNKFKNINFQSLFPYDTSPSLNTQINFFDIFSSSIDTMQQAQIITKEKVDNGEINQNITGIFGSIPLTAPKSVYMEEF